MVEVKRKQKETIGSLLRRFSQRIQRSGILTRARKLKFYESRPTYRQRKESALHRAKMRKEIEKLKKLGKFEEK